MEKENELFKKLQKAFQLQFHGNAEIVEVKDDSCLYYCKQELVML